MQPAESAKKGISMYTRHLLSSCMVAVAATFALVGCGGGGSDSGTSTSAPVSQLVPRGNVNDAKGAYDRIVDGMTSDQAGVFLGTPDYFQKGQPGEIPDGTILDIYQWAFADGSILQLTYKNGRLWVKILGNANQTLSSQRYF